MTNNYHDNLRGGSRLRLLRYKNKANESARRIEAQAAKREGREPREVKAEPGAWKKHRWVTPHGLGFSAPSHSCFRSAERRVIHMDSGALDHLREIPREDQTRDYGRGWYCDAYQSETISGHVAMLPHGRFLAWIKWSDADGITIDATTYHDSRTAQHSADHMAETWAREEREHNEKWQEARKHDEEREEAREELKAARAEASRLVAALREQRRAGAIVPALCDVLRAKVGECRERMREALESIAEHREAIEELGMVGEF